MTLASETTVIGMILIQYDQAAMQELARVVETDIDR